MPTPNSEPMDTWLALRKAWVAALKADAALTALVSASSIYGEQPPANPAWPFIRIGPQISTPWNAVGWSGALHRLSTHCFSNGPYTDAVSRIASAVVDVGIGFALSDEHELTIEDIQWIGSNTIRDGDEADKWHAIVDFDITLALREAA